MITDSFSLAFKSLGRRRLRSWLTIIGIFIGIAAVVALISLGEGMRDAVAAQFSSLGSDKITVAPRSAGFGPPGLGSDVKLTTADLEVVQRANYVDQAAGRILQPVTMEFNRRSNFQFMASLPDDLEERSVIENFLDPVLIEGRMIRPDDLGKVTIGSNVATGWGSTDITAGNTIEVEGTKLEVVGILQKKGIPQADEVIIINEEDARTILNITDEYQFIIAQVEEVENIELAVEAVTKDLRNFRGVDEREEDFEVSSPQEVLATLDEVLGTITAVLVGIAAISLIVGGIGIMNTMYTAVIERTREIGIMKAVGATNGQVLTIFLIESGLLGLVGAIIGVGIGVGLSKAVELAAVRALGPNVLQATTPLWLLLGALAFGFLTGSISGILPAKQAAEMQPVEALSK